VVEGGCVFVQDRSRMFDCGGGKEEDVLKVGYYMRPRDGSLVGISSESRVGEGTWWRHLVK
jgi:hypothetical protein